MARTQRCISAGFVLLFLLATCARAEDEQKLWLGAELDLAIHTTPTLQSVSVSRQKGLLLYRGYFDLSGKITLAGSPAQIEALAKEIKGLSGTHEFLNSFLMRLHRYDERGELSNINLRAADIRFEVTFDPATNQLGIKDNIPQDIMEIAFRIPAEQVAAWPEGKYLFEIAKWIPADGGRKTAGAAPMLFYVKDAARGTPDELNLLTNAWLDHPQGLGRRLIKAGTYTPETLYTRVLELDPNDVLVRYRKAYFNTFLSRDYRACLDEFEAIRKLVEEGKAHRVEGLYGFRRCWTRGDNRLAQFYYEIRMRMLAVEVLDQEKRKADAILRDAGVPGLLERLAMSDEPNVWTRTMLARACADSGDRACVPVLRAELRKLPRAPGLLQIEMVAALAKLEDAPNRAMDWWTRSTEENLAVLDGWHDEDPQPKAEE